MNTRPTHYPALSRRYPPDTAYPTQVRNAPVSMCTKFERW